MMERRWGRQEKISPSPVPADTKPEDDAMDRIAPVEAVNDLPGIGTGKEKLGDDDKPRMLDIIASMRTKGNSWEKIARHMDDQNIPTVSGKGKWRGPAIKKFWDANS
jgi:hypothetical protein